MANPIKKGDIAEKGVLDNLINGGKKALAVLDDLLKATIELGKQQKKNIEQLKKAPKTIKNRKELTKEVKKANETAKAVNKTRTETAKIDKQIIAAEEKLKRLNSTKGSQLAELNLLASKQNVINKEEAILNQRKLGTLERISVQNKQLIRERRALNLDEDEGVERLREINEQLDKNNKRIKENVSALEQQKINIGNYKEEVSEAIKENELLTDALNKVGGAGQAAITLFTNLAKTFKKTEQAEEGVASGANKIRDSLKKAGILAVIALLSTLGAAFTKTREGTLRFDRLVGSLTSSLSVLTGALSEVGLGLIDLGKASISFFKGDIFDSADVAEKAIDRISSAFDGFGDRIVDNVLNNDDLIISTFRYRDSLRELERQISVLQAREELQQAIADDATLSFRKREEAIKESIRLSEVRIRKQRELAQFELDFANERLNIELREANQKELSNKQLLDLINNEELRLKVSEEALEKQQAAILALTEAENELLLIQKEQQKVVGELKQDRLERDLDILIDGFDNQKTINERLINDDRKTLEERRKIFEETARLANKSFTAQKDVLAQLSNAGIDVDELLKLDAVTLNERIRSLEQSEIIEGRTLEVVRERRLVLQDLADIERELSDLEKAKEQRRLASLQAIRQEELAGQIEHQERLLDNLDLSAEEQIKITEKIFDLRIQSIQEAAEFQIEQLTLTEKAAEENAEQVTLIAQKLANDIKSLEHEKLLAVQDANKAILENDEATAEKRLESARRLGQNVVREFLSELDQINKAKIDALNNDISSAEDSVKEQERIAAAGGEAIVGEEKARLAKLRLERKRELEEQALLERRIALAQNFVNALASYSKEDPQTAFAKAAFETFAGAAFAKVIAGFEEGGYTGDVGTSDVAGVVHGKEFVIDAPTTARLGLKGASMSDFNNRLDSNSLMSPSHFRQLEVSQMVQPNNVNLMPMIMEQKKGIATLKKTIEDNRPIYNSGLNKSNEWFEEEFRRNVRKRTTNKRPRL